MLKLRFQSRIRKTALCHRDLNICRLKLEVKFVVVLLFLSKAVTSLYQRQSIMYISLMTWQCYIATMVNHEERKKKGKRKKINIASFFNPKKPVSQTRTRKLYSLNRNEQNLSVLAWQLRANQIPNAPLIHTELWTPHALIFQQVREPIVACRSKE